MHLGRTRLLVATLVVVTLAGAGLRATRAAEPGRFLAADERAYGTLALGLARHGDYGARRLEHPFHWPPGTPALFAVADKLSFGADGATPGQLRSAPWAQAVVGTAVIPAAFALAFLLAGWAAGMAAAAAVAFYPPYTAITGDLVSEPLGALTLTLAMVALATAWRRPTAQRTAMAGVVLGAAVLVRADLLPLPFLLAAVLAVRVWMTSGRRGRAVVAAAVYLGGALTLLGPWSAYASLASGRFVPVSDGGSSALYVATYLPGHGTMYGFKAQLADEARRIHPRAVRRDDAQIPAQWALDAVVREDGDRTQGRASILTEGVLHNMRRYALGDPLDFAAMTAGKLGRMWLGYDRGTHHAQRTWVLAIHLALIFVAVIGLGAGLRRRRDPLLAALAGVVAVGTLVNAFFVAEPRHNARLLPILIAIGAAGLTGATRRRPSPPDGSVRCD